MRSSLLGTFINPTDEATEEEITLISIQIIVTVFFLITTFIALLLSYDLYLKKTNQKPLFTDQEANQLDSNNHLFILALVIIMVFVSYGYLQIKEERGDDTRNSNIQLWVSTITLIAGIMSTYVSLDQLNNDFNFSDIENPTT